MNTYSSTSLGYLNKYGPEAFRLHLAGAPFDRRVFQVGIAAHAVLEECGRKGAKKPEDVATVADAVVRELCINGRSYFGTPEPPMSLDDAMAGRDLAVAYLAAHELPGGEFEAALYSPDLGTDGKPRARALVDQWYEEERGDEESAGLCLIVRDYKSAWTADASELETLQRKMQAVLAWQNLVRREHVGLVLEVVNLRTGVTHSRTIWLDEEGEALLSGWYLDLLLACDVADAARTGTGCRPGIPCMGCPFLLGCQIAETARQQAGTREQMAGAFVLCAETRKALAVVLKEALKEREPLPVAGGSVGFQVKTKNVPAAAAAERVLSEWYESLGQALDLEELQLLKAPEISLVRTIGLTGEGLDRIGKALWPERKDVPHRREWIAGLLEERVSVEFGEVKA